MNTPQFENPENEINKTVPCQKLSDKELLRFNQQGLIPAPGESEEAFSSRAQACLALKSLLSTQEFQKTLPFDVETSQPEEALKGAYSSTKHLFDIQPAWLPFFYSNYRLTPWHGGCAWIFQLADEGPRMAFLQLRKAFAKNQRYLLLYERDELIAHECAHVGRMLFEEPRFEEVLAYRTNPSKWRAWLGPIVQSATESLIFITVLFATLLLDFYHLLIEDYETYLSLGWLKLAPLGLFFLALGRLWKKQKIFKNCLSHLQALLGDETSANHVIYRLSDHEIYLFATLSEPSILEYVHSERVKSLRWHLLWLAYFQNASKDA